MTTYCCQNQKVFNKWGVVMASHLGNVRFDQNNKLDFRDSRFRFRPLAGAAMAVALAAPAFVHAQCVTELQRFDYSGAIVTYTVPSTGSYWLEAAGAQGSNNTSSTYAAGLGALIGGQFSLTNGAQLRILAGQQVSASGGNGGGGGSFVTDSSNSPLVVAGGGAGSGNLDNPGAKDGQAGNAGGAGSGGGGAGGTAGQGGSVGASGFQSGAGGGLLTNGADGWTTNTGGLAFVNGGAGGSANAPASGGFGGGGSGSSYVVGGGGGGYSGGGGGGNAAGGMGGGGGSFNGGASASNQAGVNTGNGYVRICSAAAPPAPPPATVQAVPVGGPWVLSALGAMLGLLGWRARRRSGVGR